MFRLLLFLTDSCGTDIDFEREGWPSPGLVCSKRSEATRWGSLQQPVRGDKRLPGNLWEGRWALWEGPV